MITGTSPAVKLPVTVLVAVSITLTLLSTLPT
jgi:hypothetical protein